MAALAVIFRWSLRGRYARVPEVLISDRLLLAVAMTVCLGLGPCSRSVST
jgi:hypothetical protein